jgi:hypothetical protein
MNANDTDTLTPTAPAYVHPGTLYDITGNIAQTLRMIEEILESPDLAPEAQQAAINTELALLNTLGESLNSKMENCARYVRNEERGQEILKAEEAMLAAKRQASARRVEAIRGYMLMCLKSCATGKVKTALVSAWIGKRSKVFIEDPAKLPQPADAPQYWHIYPPPPPAPDLKVIGDVLKLGDKVPGAVLTETEFVTFR